VTESILNLPTWIITRTLGLTSYFLLFLGVASGVLFSMPIWKVKTKKRILNLHNLSNWSGLSFGLLHALILIIDSYLPFTWFELSVPFTSANEPFWNGLGTVAIYGLILVLVTTDLRNRIGRNLWRTVHLLAYPIFVITLIHGISVGTDIRLDWIKGLYWITFGVIVLLTIMRIYYFSDRNTNGSSMIPKDGRPTSKR
jgi:sulfoxide reductase heme-binding subunit YedZ